MKYVLIGCGRIAVNHIKAAIDNKLEIAAVCDILPERMDLLLSKFGLSENGDIRRYMDYKAMLSDVKPELAAIATESGRHAEIALYCLNVGVNVIIEKPMAMSIGDADRLIKKAAQTGLKVCACHQNRFNLSVMRLRKAIDNGRFGKISHGSVNVRWNRGRDYYDQAKWRGTWEQDGGCLMNQCIHGIDLLRWLMGGEIFEVYGQIRKQTHSYLETEDAGMAVITFKNGAIATVEGTTNVYPENLEETLYIFGENGTAKLGGKSCNSIEIWEFSDENEGDSASIGFTEKTENVYGNGHTSLYADMIDAVLNDREPYVNAQAGKDAIETVLAIYKSQKTGKSVKLPLNAFSTENMRGVL